MKRNIKLFLTISSLCMAVCMMAFGVYAASTVTYTINGSVSYTFDDALIKVTRTISTVTLDVPPLEETDLSTLSYTGEKSSSFETYDVNNKWKEPQVPDGFTSGQWQTNAMSETISFDLNASYAYKVEVKVETKNTDGVTITYNLPTAVSKNYRIANNAENFKSASVLKAGQTATIIYYVALIDNTLEISADPIVASFNFAKA